MTKNVRTRFKPGVGMLGKVMLRGRWQNVKPVSKIKEYEKTIKSLVDQLSKLQEQSEKDNFIKLQDKHEEKKRELKKSNNNLRKAEEKNKNLLQDISNLNKKVSSLAG